MRGGRGAPTLSRSFQSVGPDLPSSHHQQRLYADMALSAYLDCDRVKQRSTARLGRNISLTLDSSDARVGASRKPELETSLPPRAVASSS